MLIDRLHEAKTYLTPVQSKYRVVFEDPTQPDIPAMILVPDPNWMAAALHGGILPPVESYDHGREHTTAEPIGPMTEEEAIEYLIQKDIPRHIWTHKGNRQVMKVVNTNTIPTDRTFRNAWTITQED